MNAAVSRRFTGVVMPVCMAGMDSVAIFIVSWLIWAAIFSTLLQPPAPPLILGALELAAWWLSNYLLDNTRLPLGAVQAMSGLIGIALSLVAALALNPAPAEGYSLPWLGASVLTIAVCLVVWFLGGYRASERVDFNEAYATFRIAIIAVGLVALLVTLIAGKQVSLLLGGLGAAPVWFFAWSLASLIVGHQELVREESGAGVTGSWGLVSGISVGLVLLVGLVGGAFGGQNLLGALQQLVVGVLALVGLIIYSILFAILWLLSLIHISFGGPSNNQPTPTPTPQPTNNSDPFEQLRRQFEAQTGLQAPIELRDIVIWISALLVVALIAWVITRALRRASPDRERNASEERISLGVWPRLEAHLRLWLARLLARFRHPPASLAAEDGDDLASLQGHPEWLGTLSIRQIYARLQVAAARTGLPRQPQSTPVEYLWVLSSARPDLSGDLAQITSAYIEARYGPLPAPAPSVAAANEAWRRTEPALKGLRGR